MADASNNIYFIDSSTQQVVKVAASNGHVSNYGSTNMFGSNAADLCISPSGDVQAFGQSASGPTANILTIASNGTESVVTSINAGGDLTPGTSLSPTSDSTGHFYVTSGGLIYKVSQTGAVTTITPPSGWSQGADNASGATFMAGSDGSLYGINNFDVVTKLAPNGTAAPLTGSW